MKRPLSLLLPWVFACVAAAVTGDAPAIRDLDGRVRRPFQPAGKAGVVFFVLTDCPISNGYAPTIASVCREYASKGVDCTVAYEDVEAPRAVGDLNDVVRAHLAQYGYQGMPAVVDRTRALATFAGVTVTPEAVVVDAGGRTRYRGRIDNFYAALGKPRRQVTVHDVRDALDAVLEGRAVATPRTEAVGCYIVNPDVLRDSR